MAHTLHQAPVACDHEGVVVDGLLTEHATEVTLGECHADRIREPLTERAGGDLDASGVSDLGMAGGGRTPLPEGLDVVEFEAIAAQEQQRVLQDRGMSSRQDEAIAVAPQRIGGVMLHHSGVQNVRQGRQRHRSSLVAALGVERSVHGQTSDEGDGLLFLLRGKGVGHET